VLRTRNICLWRRNSCLSDCPRELFGENTCFSPRSYIRKILGDFFCSWDLCSWTQGKDFCSWDLCSWKQRKLPLFVYSLRILCSSNLSKICFGGRDLRAEGCDPWSDRRLVLRCHVSGLWTGAMMAMKYRCYDPISRGGPLAVRSKQRFAFFRIEYGALDPLY
jgi:hypothetical protein